MDEKIFISKQISKYATSGKLIEFIDKLNVPPITNYAHVQASGDKDSDGNTIYSNIGIKMLDYSNGTGEKTISGRVCAICWHWSAVYSFCGAAAAPTEISKHAAKSVNIILFIIYPPLC